jgi:polar amino acid transport system ATP-binding protein
MQIRMALCGRVQRGYCPVGNALTAGKPNWKEGIYFGAELAPTHPAMQQFPLHSAKLFQAIPQFRETVLESLTLMT